MTNAALRGKPDAGNPHVRFDEGEVAPAATPRRGSLLYKKINILEMIDRASKRPHKSLSAEQRDGIRQAIAQSFVDVQCAYRAVMEGLADWKHFTNCGKPASEFVKKAIATGDQELTSLACYLNDALMSITYFHMT